MGASCCHADRPAAAFDSPSAASPIAVSSPEWARVSQKVPHDPEHELEWTIVAESIEDDELCRLRELHAQVEDCDMHPTCRRRPLHRQAQTLLRFLRGRDGNVPRAEKMFRDMLDWRHRFDVEGKVHAWRRELERGRTVRARLCKIYGVETDHINDKYGIPVRLFRISVADTAGLIREFGQEAVLVDSLSKLENWPSYKIWAKEKGLKLAKTKHESETLFRKKKTMRRQGLLRSEHFSNTSRSREWKREKADWAERKRIKRKAILRKRRQRLAAESEPDLPDVDPSASDQ